MVTWSGVVSGASDPKQFLEEELILLDGGLHVGKSTSEGRQVDLEHDQFLWQRRDALKV